MTEQMTLIQHDDPLELKIRRSRYSRQLLGLIFRTPGSFLGRYSFNWMAAGALVDMIEAIFKSDERVYRERRKALREMGMKDKPSALAFDVFRVVVDAFPASIHRQDIVTALKAKYPGVDVQQVRIATDYLKGFTAKACGFSILPDFDGGVMLADVEARMRFHLHNRRTSRGIEDTEHRHGVKTLRSMPDVRQLPAYEQLPLLEFNEKAKELPDASD